MSNYNIITSTNESTVVAEYTAEYRTAAEYQSEADLEREFIQNLTRQGYEYITFHNEAALINNLRIQLEVLNGIAFSDDEWEHFFGECIASQNEGIVEKTRKIQDDHVQVLKRDDGSTKNIYLLDKKNIHNNRLQVLNQYTEAGGTHDTRYDVMALVTAQRLKEEETRRFIDIAFRDGTLKTTGTDIDRILPPVSRFGGGNRAEKKQLIIEALLVFFEKYFGLL